MKKYLGDLSQLSVSDLSLFTNEILDDLEQIAAELGRKYTLRKRDKTRYEMLIHGEICLVNPQILEDILNTLKKISSKEFQIVLNFYGLEISNGKSSSRYELFVDHPVVVENELILHKVDFSKMKPENLHSLFITSEVTKRPNTMYNGYDLGLSFYDCKFPKNNLLDYFKKSFFFDNFPLYDKVDFMIIENLNKPSEKSFQLVNLKGLEKLKVVQLDVTGSYAVESTEGLISTKTKSLTLNILRPGSDYDKGKFGIDELPNSCEDLILTFIASSPSERIFEDKENLINEVVYEIVKRCKVTEALSIGFGTVDEVMIHYRKKLNEPFFNKLFNKVNRKLKELYGSR
jgi:hypothetical protein